MPIMGWHRGIFPNIDFDTDYYIDCFFTEAPYHLSVIYGEVDAHGLHSHIIINVSFSMLLSSFAVSGIFLESDNNMAIRLFDEVASKLFRQYHGRAEYGLSGCFSCQPSAPL